jgi:putative ubiquitin-RnfH superfamily antitoxin RatB of RatAB toxin-antitoxin module
MPEMLTIEVIYALPAKQQLVTLKLPAGSTVRQAIDASGLLQKHPEIDLAKNKIGVFAKLSKPDALLRDHDRVEIYRPLIADPKEVRKQRAAAGKVMKKGAGEARVSSSAYRNLPAPPGGPWRSPPDAACHPGNNARPCCRASPRGRRTPVSAARCVPLRSPPVFARQRVDRPRPFRPLRATPSDACGIPCRGRPASCRLRLAPVPVPRSCVAAEPDRSAVGRKSPSGCAHPATGKSGLARQWQRTG